MSTYSKRLSRLRGGGEPTVSPGLKRAIEEALTGEETVCEGLTSNTGLRRPEGEDLLAAEGDGTAVAVTDRRVVIGVGTPDGPTLVTVDYTTVKDVQYAGGMLRNRFEIERWGAGPLRFQPSTGDAEPVGERIEGFSEAWDRVETLMKKASGEVSDYGHRMTAGDVEAALRHRAAAERHVADARDYVAGSPVSATDGLEARIEELEQELARARVRGRITHSQACRERAGDLRDRGAVPEAHAALRTARRDFEMAYEVATEWDFDTASSIASAAEDLKTEIEELEAHPIAAGREAHQNARTAESLERGIVHWEEALEHYRTAMTAGWGIEGADFEGDRDDLAARIETVVWELIDARCALAENLVSEGDELSMSADNRTARDRYQAATQQLGAALALADEFRAGDPERLRERLEAVRNRRSGLGARQTAIV